VCVYVCVHDEAGEGFNLFGGQQLTLQATLISSEHCLHFL
jgi:hypothetical protein